MIDPPSGVALSQNSTILTVIQRWMTIGCYLGCFHMKSSGFRCFLCFCFKGTFQVHLYESSRHAAVPRKRFGPVPAFISCADPQSPACLRVFSNILQIFIPFIPVRRFIISFKVSVTQQKKLKKFLVPGTLQTRGQERPGLWGGGGRHCYHDGGGVVHQRHEEEAGARRAAAGGLQQQGCGFESQPGTETIKPPDEMWKNRSRNIH